MKVYLDNAATTALDSEVLEKMMPYLTEIYGNPSNQHHSFGREAVKGVDTARKQVADALNASPDEIIFTAGGTEADNLAIKGILQKYKSKGNHIITTAVEHHAIMHTCEQLEKDGYDVTFLPVDEFGAVSAEAVENAIKDSTVLVSVMFANNEVGTIMPIAEIGEICRRRKVYFHTDAVQAIGHIAIDVKAMNIDMLSLSAHKFHGPKGVGALYVRRGIGLMPQMTGGAQERKRRAGTENVPGIVGLGAAIEKAAERIAVDMPKVAALRDKLIEGIESTIPEVKRNGHRQNRLPNNVNISIKYIEGESVLMMLDMLGIAASSGSACASASIDPSHVLLAMGIPHETAHGSIRLTLSDKTTEEEIDYVIKTLPTVVERLRKMSPLYNK